MFPVVGILAGRLWLVLASAAALLLGAQALHEARERAAQRLNLGPQQALLFRFSSAAGAY